jgi:TIGR03009 family protein
VDSGYKTQALSTRYKIGEAMRFWLAQASILVACSTLSAQQPPAPTAGQLDPANARLEAILLQWEEKMKSVETLSAQVVQEKVDNVLRSRTVYQGYARFMKPNRALLFLQQQNKPDRYLKYISTGTFFYEYNQLSQEVRIHEMPQTKTGRVGDDNVLSFLFDMKAEEAKRRYELKLIKENDPNYIYVEVTPRLPADRADFTKAYFALTRKDLLPRALMFEEPNGNRNKWDMPVLEIGARIDPTEFASPTIPQGWKVVRMPRTEVAPRVVRPNGQ